MALLAAQGLYRMAAWPYHSASPSEPRAGTGPPASLAHSARICGLACKSAICSSSCRCWDGPMSRRLGHRWAAASAGRASRHWNRKARLACRWIAGWLRRRELETAFRPDRSDRAYRTGRVYAWPPPSADCSPTQAMDTASSNTNKVRIADVFRMAVLLNDDNMPRSWNRPP